MLLLFLPPVNNVKTEKMILDKVGRNSNFLASPEHTPKMAHHLEMGEWFSTNLYFRHFKIFEDI